MNAVTHWNPLREMDDFFSRIQRGFGRVPAEIGQTAEWAPSVDIAETDKEYLIKADLSGVKKEDIKVNVQNGLITLSGERRFEKEEKDKKHHRIERSYGAFTRSFALPDDVLEDKIEAECKDGVVSVHLPKTDIKKSASTEIKVK